MFSDLNITLHPHLLARVTKSLWFMTHYRVTNNHLKHTDVKCEITERFMIQIPTIFHLGFTPSLAITIVDCV